MASGKKYFLLLVDDKSRYMWLVLLAIKSDMLTLRKGSMPRLRWRWEDNCVCYELTIGGIHLG
jgi:hypothetical protein